MIEPTDEMREAFYADTGERCDILGCVDCFDDRLAAVLAIVERDYEVRERVVVHLATKGDGHVHCYGRTPFELPRGDRTTLDPHGFNCAGPYT